MVNHTVGSLFSCQSGCNRWPHTFLNSLMIDTIPSWLNIHTEELYNIFSGAQFESDSSHRGPTAQVQAASKKNYQTFVQILADKSEQPWHQPHHHPTWRSIRTSRYYFLNLYIYCNSFRQAAVSGLVLIASAHRDPI